MVSDVRREVCEGLREVPQRLTAPVVAGFKSPASWPLSAPSCRLQPRAIARLKIVPLPLKVFSGGLPLNIIPNSAGKHVFPLSGPI